MKALVYQGPGKKALEDRPKPEIRPPTDAIVRIVEDDHLRHRPSHPQGRRAELRPGRILGHEGVGVVEKVGPA